MLIRGISPCTYIFDLLTVRNIGYSLKKFRFVSPRLFLLLPISIKKCLRSWDRLFADKNWIQIVQMKLFNM